MVKVPLTLGDPLILASIHVSSPPLGFKQKIEDLAQLRFFICTLLTGLMLWEVKIMMMFLTRETRENSCKQ